MIVIRRSALISLGLLTLAACGQPASPADAAGPAAAATTAAQGAAATAAESGGFVALFADGACYARTYDAAHLAAHPRQTVEHFFLTEASAEWAALNTADQHHLGLAFSLRDSSDIFVAVAICAPRGAGASCGIEGDGGEFTLTPQGARLRIDIARMEVEGQEGFSPDLAAGDNRVILLERTETTACLVD